MRRLRKAEIDFGVITNRNSVGFAGDMQRVKESEYLKRIKGIENLNLEGIQVNFSKRFSGIPSVTLSAAGTNQNVVAENVTTTGFRLILSDEAGFDSDKNADSFQVHYHAIFIFKSDAGY